MTLMKNIVWGMVAMGMFMLAPLVQAQEAGDANFSRGHSPHHFQEIYDQLNLTDDQKKQLESTKEQHRASMERGRREMKADKEALQAELMKTQLDMPRVNTLHQRIKECQAQMEDNRLSSILAVRSILTPEQFVKFVSLMHKHK